MLLIWSGTNYLTIPETEGITCHIKCIHMFQLLIVLIIIDGFLNHLFIGLSRVVSNQFNLTRPITIKWYLINNV